MKIEVPDNKGESYHYVHVLLTQLWRQGHSTNMLSLVLVHGQELKIIYMAFITILWFQKKYIP